MTARRHAARRRTDRQGAARAIDPARVMHRHRVMPDERQESTAEGIAPAPESCIGREADRRRREQVIRTPPEAQPESAMGGTSDADSPADEAWTPRPPRP